MSLTTILLSLSLIGYVFAFVSALAPVVETKPATMSFDRKGKQIFANDSHLAMLRKSAKIHGLKLQFTIQKNGLLVIRNEKNKFVSVIKTLDTIHAMNACVNMQYLRANQ